MAVKLIALDIDGTLLDSRWTLPEANRAAIAEATRRGIEVALVTGRRYDFAMPIAMQLGSPLTMIVSNGAVIRTQDGQTPSGSTRKLPHGRSVASDAIGQSRSDARCGSSAARRGDS